MKKNNLLKTIFPILFTILIVAWFLYYLSKHQSDFEILKAVSWQNLSLLLILGLGCIFLQGQMLLTVITPFKIKLKFREWFGINILTTLGNYIVPFGGLGFRAAYLKKVYHFDYTHFISTLGATLLIQFMIASIGGMIGLTDVFIRTRTLNQLMAISFILVFVVCMIFIFWSPKIPTYQNKPWKRFKGIIDSWYRVKKDTEMVKRLTLIILLNFLFNFLIFYLSMKILNIEVSFLSALLPTSLSVYSVIFRMTPASLGFYEGLVIYASRALSLTTTQALMVAILTRIAILFWAVALGLIFAYFLLYKKGRNKKIKRS